MRTWAGAVLSCPLPRPAACGRINFDPNAGAGAGAGAGSGSDATASVECGPGVPFCNGFEDTEPTPFEASTASAGNITVTGSLVHSGAKAFQATIGAGGYGYACAHVWSAQTTGSLYARSFFYVTSTTGTAHLDLLTFSQDRLNGPPNVHVGAFGGFKRSTTTSTS
jgi:hypothetical protein